MCLLPKDAKIIEDWRKLQTSDHFYYMCTKWFADGDVHKYFNPYDTPYEAFIAYNNVLHDLKMRIESRRTDINVQKAGTAKKKVLAIKIPVISRKKAAPRIVKSRKVTAKKKK